ncbi:MAG: glycoside hydrolase family 2 [Clostridia bacterium]|nr:glycoside hydrolase family 2 [Clostridia bacterium]
MSWNQYPRPLLQRDSYYSLNGTWDFAAGEENYNQQIQVPSCVEDRGQVLWYRKHFTLPKDFLQSRTLLHFGAVDQIARVYLNGQPVGTHEGGYLPFTLDVTAALQEDNVLTVEVRDHLQDKILPYGKQKYKRGGMWYTPVSGIWQTVWLESVPENYIEAIQVRNGLDWVEITVRGVSAGAVTIEGMEPAALENGVCRINIVNPHLWSPEDPYLYHFTIRAGDDQVRSYFALRTVDIREVDGYPRICLNGKPYFFHGLLDQGYWQEGIYTPESPDAFEKDILFAKGLGFNMLRKHIKIEPQLFYYACDRLGMIVFQDMVNNGSYSFLRDTALPTVGVQYLPDRWLHRNKARRTAFVQAMEATVEALRNHPCICYWTIFNEGWGQFEGSRMYGRLKALDDSRVIDTASGWFSGVTSDVDSRHVYFRKVRLKAGRKPLVLSEFGGYSYKVEGHVFNPEKAYGYGKCATRTDFVAALRKVYVEEVAPLVPKGLCAAVYTQLSDVEDEINGLITYDRQVEKVKPEEFFEISRGLCDRESLA